MTPEVSVLIPVCNVERYLDECLESAEHQTLENIEIICINDGSRDRSLDIIKEHAARDSRIKIIDKPNSGYGDSMNKGIELAEGRYIAILESDDYLDPEALKYMVSQADSQSLDVFKCNFWMYWSESLPQHAYRHNLYHEALTPAMVGLGPHCPADCPDIFWAKPSIWSALYRREFLNENGIRFLPTPGASYQDSSFTFKVFACARRVAYSGQAFLHYRQDNENSSVNSKGKVYCTCDEHAEIKRFLNEDRPDLKAVFDPVRVRVKFQNYRWNFDRLEGEKKLEFLGRFRDEMREEIDEGAISSALIDGSMFRDEESAPFCYFFDGEIDEIKMIVKDMNYYYAHRLCEKSASKMFTLKTYYRLGGLRFVWRALRRR